MSSSRVSEAAPTFTSFVIAVKRSSYSSSSRVGGRGAFVKIGLQMRVSHGEPKPEGET
jgi:hypothetical protein